MDGQQGSGGGASAATENDLREKLLPRHDGEIEEAPETSETSGTNREGGRTNGEEGRGGILQRLPSLRPPSFLSGFLDREPPLGEDGEPDYSNRRLLGGWTRVGRGALKRRVSMVLICFLVLVGDANRGLVLPTLQEYIGIYGGNSSVLGLANAGFSLGRLLAAPLYGYWMDERNPGEVVLFSMVVCLVCNLMYTFASQMPHPPVIIVVTRTVLGFGASVLGVGRAYIAKQTSKAERGPYIAILCALQYAGFTLTAFISVIDFEGVGTLTKYTLPGYVLSVSYLVGILALCLIPNSLFDGTGHTANNHRSMMTSSQYNSSSYPYLLQLEKEAQAQAAAAADQESLLGDKNNSQSESQPPGSITKSRSLRSLLRVPKIVIVFILLNFTVRAVLATLETLSTYIISYLYTGSLDPKVWQMDGAPFLVALTFTFIGIGGLVIFIGVYFLSKHLQDRVTLILGLSFIAVGIGITLDPRDGKGLDEEMSLLRFQVGLSLVWAIGYPLSQTVVVSALSKVLSSEQQGIWMGNLASAGSAGRIIAPTVAGYVYHAAHEHTGLIPLACCFGITALSMMMVTGMWSKLKVTD